MCIIRKCKCFVGEGQRQRMRNILVFGDSNTYGYDPADPYENRYPYEERWTSILAEELKDSYEIRPEGMNGRRLPDLRYDHRMVLRLIEYVNGDGILCTMLGTNDVLITGGAEEAISRMNAYLSFLLNHLRAGQIVIIAPPYIGSPMLRDATSRMYYEASVRMNEAFGRMAGMKGVRFIDASKWDIELAYDNVHFSTRGHRVFAEKMAGVLQDGECPGLLSF